jgi:hypothetical protein
MRRRVFRHLFTLCSAASLLPSGAGGIAMRTATLLIAVTLIGCAAPSRPTAGSENAGSLAVLIDHLDNRQIEWGVGQYSSDRQTEKFHLEEYGAVVDTPAEQLGRGHIRWRDAGRGPSFSRQELTHALLRALEDPGKVIAAHWLLTEIYHDTVRAERVSPPPARSFEKQGDSSFVCMLDGLEIQLTLLGPPVQRSTTSPWPHYALDVYRTVAAASPTQIPVLRRQWLRRVGGT